MEWNFLLPLVITGLRPIFDAAIKGEALGSNAIKGIQTAYAMSFIWGQDVIDSTENDLDNAAMREFRTLAEDTAREGNFPLPVLSMPE